MHQTDHRRTALGGVVAALAVALLAAGLMAQPRHAGAVNIGVSVVDDDFSPNSVNAVVGDQVIWDATTDTFHTATAVEGEFNHSFNDSTDAGAYTVQAADAGTTIWYYCSAHASAALANEAGLAAGAMVGRIVVAAQATATATPTTATATTTTATATATATATTATATSTSTSTPTATATTVPATATATAPAGGATSPAGTTATAAPAPPATGSGTVAGTNSAFLLIVAGLAGLGLTGGAMVAIRRRS